MTPDSPEPTCYSIQIRVQRVTMEYAYVNVPATFRVSSDDGKTPIDIKKLADCAVEISRMPGVKWYVEKQGTTPHPIQNPMEPGEERMQGPFPT